MVGAPVLPIPVAPDWIAVCWGTARLRAWAVGGDGTVLAGAESSRGTDGLEPAGFEPALLELVGPWLDPRRITPVVACGTVGARPGWAEAGYRAVPCAPLGLPATVAPALDPRIRVSIVPGLSQLRPSPDVMQGEETQIAGVLAAHPGWDGVVCLTGVHSKWAEVSAGEVVSFRSFMTGELQELLATRSMLRHSLADGGEAAGSGDLDEPAFDEALAQAMARPEALAARLFSLLAEGLLKGLSPAAARARLAGLLIGAELAAARPWWLGRDIIVVGAAGAAPYARALKAQGVAAEVIDADAAALAGLAQARALLRDAAS